MLPPNELKILNAMISDEGKTFEAIASDFQTSYSKIEQFKFGVTLWFLIKDNLLNLSQRLASFYILYDMYKNEKVTSTPFIPIVLETLQTSTNKIEQRFLVDLLQSSIDYQDKSIKEFKEEKAKLMIVEIPDLSEYWNKYNKLNEKFSRSINDWIRPVIYNKSLKEDKNIETNPPFNVRQLTPEEVSFNYFEPNYLTYYPNSNYPFLEDEPMWIMPTLNYDFIWDFNMTPEKDKLGAILKKPLNDKPVSDEQIKFATGVIEKAPNILKEINFTPDDLMKLVDKNEKFASKILLSISKDEIFQE